MITIGDYIRDEIESLLDNMLDEIPDDEWIIQRIKKMYKPEDIFESEDLEAWALSNGFIQSDVVY